MHTDREKNSMTKESIGEKLKRLRIDKGVTLQEAADAVGYSPSYIHRLENNHRKNPGIRIVAELADFYNVSIESFTGKNDLIKSEMVIAECQQANQLIKGGIEKLKDIENEQSLDLSEMKDDLIQVRKCLLHIQSLL